MATQRPRTKKKAHDDTPIVLFMDDDPKDVVLIQQRLQHDPSAKNVEPRLVIKNQQTQWKALIAQSRVAGVVSDLVMQTPEEGITILEDAHAIDPTIPLTLLSHHIPTAEQRARLDGIGAVVVEKANLVTAMKTLLRAGEFIKFGPPWFSMVIDATDQDAVLGEAIEFVARYLHDNDDEDIALSAYRTSTRTLRNTPGTDAWTKTAIDALDSLLDTAAYDRTLATTDYAEYFTPLLAALRQPIVNDNSDLQDADPLTAKERAFANVIAAYSTERVLRSLVKESAHSMTLHTYVKDPAEALSFTYRGDTYYPLWQFKDHHLVSGIKETAAILGLSPPGVALWLTQPHQALSASPIDCLRRGDIDTVIAAAQRDTQVP